MNASPNRQKTAVIGVDIGGTKIAAGIVTRNGSVSHLLRAPTPSHIGADAILSTVAELSRKLVKSAETEQIQIAAIGVGAGGQIDAKTGRVRYASSVIPGWEGAEIAGFLEAELCLPVRADNDVNVLALAEHQFGAARPYQNVLFVAVGTGVGGALIFENKLVHGNGFGAGDLAHVLVDYRGRRICGCGLPGHLEAYTSGPAIASAYSEKSGLATNCDLQTVAAQAQKGDRRAIEAIEEGALILGKALLGVTALLDTQSLIIGGGVTQLGELWWKPLISEIQLSPLPTHENLQIHAAALGIHASVIGAGVLVNEYF